MLVRREIWANTVAPSTATPREKPDHGTSTRGTQQHQPDPEPNGHRSPGNGPRSKRG